MHSVRAIIPDGLSDIECTLLRLPDGNYLVYKSDPKGFGCVYDLPRHRQSERTSLAHGRRNRRENHEGPQAKADSGKAKGRVLVCDRHVAVGHESHTASQRDALHSADQWFREADSYREQCFLYAADTFHVTSGGFIDLHTRTEGVPHAGQQYRPNTSVLLNSVKNLNQFFAECHRQCIALGGAIETHPQYTAVLFRFDDVSHKDLIVWHAQDRVAPPLAAVTQASTRGDSSENRTRVIDIPSVRPISRHYQTAYFLLTPNSL